MYKFYSTINSCECGPWDTVVLLDNSNNPEGEGDSVILECMSHDAAFILNCLNRGTDE